MRREPFSLLLLLFCEQASETLLSLRSEKGRPPSAFTCHEEHEGEHCISARTLERERERGRLETKRVVVFGFSVCLVSLPDERACVLLLVKEVFGCLL